MSATAEVIERHRTAMSRSALSRPLTLALQDGLLAADKSVFDYGCGRGGDVLRLRALGIPCDGWDPAYFPHQQMVRANVVNLGYVVNVIEDAGEREHALTKAWDLTDDLLIVSARMVWEANFLRSADRFRDGLLTTRSTFQRLFSQEELRDWISTTLGVQPVAAAPGVFYVFKAEEQAQAFLARRYRRITLAAPRPRISEALFNTHQALLELLMAFVTERGRLPRPEELPEAPEIQREIGSLSKAYAVIRTVTGHEQWLQIEEERRQDLLVYLALARFGRRPIVSQLPTLIQGDVKAFFGAYSRACTAADDLLFSAGRSEVIDRAARTAPVGKLIPDGLYIHASALTTLPPVLRVYEGCARTLTGFVEEGNVLKLNRVKPKISYLAYPDFDRDPHPALHAVTSASLPELRVDYRNLSQHANPPILHRKETFVAENYPLRAKFERLTKQEERQGLFDQPFTIGTRDGWQAALQEHGVILRGHRLVYV